MIPNPPRHDARDIADALQRDMPALVEHFRGAPNRALSSRSETRWGRKGSLVLHLAGRRAWRWDDYEAGTGGDGLDMIMNELGCDLPGGIEWASDWLGGAAPTPAPSLRSTLATTVAAPAVAAARPALWPALWDAASVDLMASPAGRYLVEARSIPPEIVALAAGHALRFHPACPRGPQERLPAMVALIRNVVTDEPQAVHRTFLRPDGLGKVEHGTDRMVLGSHQGGAVKISPDDMVNTTLNVAEGIETALSPMGAGHSPMWALINAGNLGAFPVLPGIECLNVWADHDRAKETPTGRMVQAGVTRALDLRDRWQQAGRECRVYFPREPGTDWNDRLKVADFKGAA